MGLDPNCGLVISGSPTRRLGLGRQHEPLKRRDAINRAPIAPSNVQIEFPAVPRHPSVRLLFKEMARTRPITMAPIVVRKLSQERVDIRELERRRWGQQSMIGKLRIHSKKLRQTPAMQSANKAVNMLLWLPPGWYCWGNMVPTLGVFPQL